MPDPRRPGSMSDDDRALVGRRRTTPAAVPTYVCTDVTGQYEGEELQAQRAKRPTAERVARLENKHDALVATVGELRTEAAKMSGQLDTLVTLAAEERDARAAREAREAAEREAKRKHVVPIITAIGVAVAAIIGAILGGR